MQTTLLGLAIALILALLAALVGPFFIDWNQVRGPFEAEATRLLGAPVRVAGPLDARLLPTPSLRLRDVTVGGANDPGRVRVAKLDVEFALGSLMRGDLRADQLSVNGFSLDLGLDNQGQVDWPAAGLSNLAALTVDRLNLTGRIALHDAASRATIELSDIAFSGDLRAQAAALRGDGNFLLNGLRYPFRLSTARATDGGTRLHLSFEQGLGGPAADLDGVVKFEGRSPSFDGNASLTVGSGDQPRTPWRIAARLAADPAAAKLDQLELSWGAPDRALKMTGSGEARFGASPQLDLALAATQLDADRAMSTGDATQPAPWLPRLRDLAATLPPPLLPTRIALDADQIMLGGRPVTDLSAELRGADQAWTLDRVDLKAPGGTHLAFSGGSGHAGSPTNLAGSLTLESADPALAAAWLRGRAAAAAVAPIPLRISGGVSASADGVVLDPLTITAGDGALAGRVAYRTRSDNRSSRAEATLKGDTADLGAAIDLAKGLLGPNAAWPDEAKVALDLGKASLGNQDWQPLIARFGYGPKTVSLDQLRIGTAGGVTLDGSGSLDRGNATGKLQLQTRAPSLVPIADAIAPFAPAVAARLKALKTAPGDAEAKLALALTNPNAGHVDAKAALELHAPQLTGETTLTAKPQVADLTGFKVDALSREAIALGAKLSAPQGGALLALLGLDRALAAGEGPATLQASATGQWAAPWQLKAKLTAAAFDAEAHGTIEPWAATPTATLALTARRLALAPLLDLPSHDADAATIDLRSQLAVAGENWTFNDIDAAVAGSHLRGYLAVTLGDVPAVDGQAGLDAIALGPAFEFALGMTGRNAADPLGRGLGRGWRGKVAFQTLRATLPGGTELQPLEGALRSDSQGLTLDVKGKLGGGDAKATVAAKQADRGIALDATLAVSGADGAELHYGDVRMPGGKVSLEATLSSVGRSAAALTGALSGGGTVTLQNARLAGLDPKAFDVAIKAGDAGQPIDDDHLAKLIAPALTAGDLPVNNLQLPISIADGRLRLAPATFAADDVRAVISGGYDIPAGQADLRATLSLTSAGAGLAPEIRIFAAGPPDRLERTVDVSALSSWLAIRRIDRETKRLQSLEHETKPASTGSATGGPSPAETSPAQTSALPPGPPSPSGKPNPTNVKPGAGAGREPDQHRPMPKPRVHASPPAAAPPQASNAATPSQREKLAPLPPPLEIRPAPGDTRPSRPRPPLVLSPPDSSRTTF